MANNIYKKFRTVEKISNQYSISKRFDEPTYFSFRLQFANNADDNYNIASNSVLYDRMPHPLFGTHAPNVNSTSIPISSIPIINIEQNYSSIQYLINTNEPTRAQMLSEFITKFNDLQNNFPYYFQQIDGVSDLLKVDPTKGQRILTDKKLTITCLEGLDLRMSYLMNLYKKIAWDDVFQRWVLPDMMRYFTLKIYLAEFRTFHVAQLSSKQKTGYGNYSPAGTETDQQISFNQIENQFANVATTPIQTRSAQFNSPVDTGTSMPLYLTVLDDILPTWVITCEMCEFDLTDVRFEHLDTLSVGSEPIQGAVRFGIKVGNIKELQTYPVFEHMFLDDKNLNNLNRSKDQISTSRNLNNKYSYPTSLQIAQNRDQETIPSSHVPGTPFNEGINEYSLFGQSGPGVNNVWGKEDAVQVDPTNPETWAGNAMNFGKAYAKNFVNKWIDKGKITSIPGLGVSYNEIKTAVQSKNIVAVLGTIRKGINEVVESYGNAPSSRLEQPIQTDDVMKFYLNELSLSEAIDDDTKLLKGMANSALNDKGLWQQIKDFSLATNLIGQGEVNIENKIQQDVLKQDNYTSLPIQSTGIPNVTPNAATGKISTETLNDKTASEQLSKNINGDLDTTVASELLRSDANIQNLDQVIASERLKSDIQDNGVKNAIASSKLSNSTQSGNVRTEKSNIRTKTIDVTQVIEYDPTSILYKKIEGESLKQPSISKATTNKIEK